MAKQKQKLSLTPALWGASGALALAFLFAVALAPEKKWLWIGLAALLVGTLGYLVYENRKALKTRTAAYGANSLATAVLVICIVGVVNFLIYRHPKDFDTTKNRVNTLSDQTVKVFKNLDKPLKVVVFAKSNMRQPIADLLDKVRGHTTRMEIEYVDPDKEVARVREASIKKHGTVQLIVGGGGEAGKARDAKVEDLNEEKLTNTLIKLLKPRAQTLCSIMGHGEKTFGSVEAEGYDAAKKALANQNYELKDVNLVQDGKIAETCDAIAILGPTKGFFPQETKVIDEYLAGGGRAVVAIDLDIKGGEPVADLIPVLARWHVKPLKAMIVDPISQRFNLDASVPVVSTYAKDHPITKEFQISSFFPLTRPLEVIAGAPAGLNVAWLAKTLPMSWGETDLSSLARGAVSQNKDVDSSGPLTVAVTVEGKLKDSKASRNTRMVVFGTSQFATNNFGRIGGNLDLFVNAVSWTLEDESLISIRSKDDTAGKVELSQTQGAFIFILTVIVIPLSIFVAGMVVWLRRRKL